MLCTDPVERLSHVVVNLGLGKRLRTGTLTEGDMGRVINCIRLADKWAARKGEPPFPWTDDEVLERLTWANEKQAAAAK